LANRLGLRMRGGIPKWFLSFFAFVHFGKLNGCLPSWRALLLTRCSSGFPSLSSHAATDENAISLPP
jgi:hypothetical protein